jgi:DNA polymerase-1
MEHPIAGEILEYRSLAKLKSTYVDSLAKLVNSKTGRIHTSFNQTVTATGRLSSSDPNLQNIPIRTPEGRKIREAFIPEDGNVFISSDYSQIELRLFAHLSQDPVLLTAFSNDEDIHSSTAAAVFGVDTADVKPEMRRKAKTINFGIIYGISAHGLSQQLKIGRQEAQEFIDAYFDKFAGVKEFIESATKKAEEDGYVTTIMDRRRYLPELKSKDRNVRAFAQRMAVNTHVQGSAADLIKLAMINIHRRLKDEKMDAAMIIQVHDELLLETPENEVERGVKIVSEEMEGVMDLSVKLKVDINTGKNWSEVH